MAASKPITVTQLNRFISALFSSSPPLMSASVAGEISNFAVNSTSGHMYFSLKDQASRISCVMFRSDAARLSFMPKDGDEVSVSGKVVLYERAGSCQINVRAMRLSGSGALYEQFQRLVEELKAKGLFDDSRKKKLPFFPKKIAVLTSQDGAAVRDIISVVARRSPATKVIVCPVPVQGMNASVEIARMLDYVNDWLECDLAIIGRGGGSIEELWPFNEMPVVEAVLRSRIPVVSAVGHETDFTVCDFVCDLRAPTPSIAAELAVPDVAALMANVAKSKASMAAALAQKVSNAESRINRAKSSALFTRPESLFESFSQELDMARDSLEKSIGALIDSYALKLDVSRKLLVSNSHEHVLGKGYAAIFKGSVPLDADKIQVGGNYVIHSRSKSANAIIGTVEERNHHNG
ncbi:MAG: exodeoxyribonuclease VII large subunit [Eubacteriaceae bacterium]|nr:exodeoxyribonuclease VII large subunit [Eubacteriaceae bacterium]